MRMNWTYRGMFRNACHLNDRLHSWKYYPVLAAHANTVANLAQRQLQCLDARKYVLKMTSGTRYTNTFEAANAYLKEFWRTQKFTRIVARILRELAKPLNPCFMFR